MQREMTLLMESANHPSIIVVADEDAADQVVAALDEGARGYVLTSATLSEVMAAIRLVRAGGVFVPASSLMAARRPAAGTGAAKPTRGSALTPRQGAVLKALSHGKPNKILAYELGMAESTVKVHVRNIMRKFGATNRTHLAFLANQATGVDVEAGGHREAEIGQEALHAEAARPGFSLRREPPNRRAPRINDSRPVHPLDQSLLGAGP
jgi:DNA-binding NarL/FixJ family response regulator